MKTGSVDFEPIDLNDLTSEVLRLARGLLVEHRVAVTVRLAPALPEARGDRVQLQQVMLNLLLNACEAMFSNEPADRALAVSTAYDERGLVVSVVDNGSGLAPQAADRVFESFFTTKDAGLGLGLSICRSIITAHGGRLSASNNVGRGATFTFALPAVAID
jgi:C4-dicarboxylate-specific signal transduction histidine kinase